MVTIGLDISSSKIGIAVLDKDENIILSEVIKFKSNTTMETLNREPMTGQTRLWLLWAE